MLELERGQRAILVPAKARERDDRADVAPTVFEPRDLSARSKGSA